MTNKELEKMYRHVVAETNLLATPIDFEDLQRRGILVKAGAWYRVRNLNELPEHACKKIYELAYDAKGTKVKFAKASSFEKLAKRSQQMETKSKSKAPSIKR